MKKLFQKYRLPLLLISIANLPGLSSIYVYRLLTKHEFEFHLLIAFPNRKELSAMIGNFSFTMLGICTALITLVFAVSGTDNFKTYKEKGHFRTLLIFYLFCIFSLIITGISSIYGLSKLKNVFMYHLMIGNFLNNLFQLFIIAFVISFLVKSSHNS